MLNLTRLLKRKNIENDAICVIGLGKLGLVKAALHASTRRITYGYDIDSNLIKKIINGATPYVETGLTELLRKGTKYLKLDYDLGYCLEHSKIVYIIVPTPSDETGKFSNEYITSVLTQISILMKDINHKLTIIVCSTVMPTSCEKVFIPLMEKLSGKKEGADFNMVYSPEFIALGNIKYNMQNPDLLLIGCRSSVGADIAEKSARRVVKNNPVISKISLVDAEISKLAVNSFITTKISFANFISEIADQTIGANAHIITEVIGSDTRIGSKYLKPGTSYGGPCFPRDNKAISEFSKAQGVNPDLAEATDEINKRQLSRLFKVVEGINLKNPKIGILGLSYKTNTSVVEESFGITSARFFHNRGFEVFGFDVFNEEIRVDESVLKLCSSAEEVLNSTDCIIVMLNCPEFRELSYKFFENKVIIDYWNFIGKRDVGSNELITMGNNHE
jgi:UDPglucose 6-dehydrogenase